MDIGNKIKGLRCKAGLTQEQLASRLGISAQSVSKWENAITMPDITLLPLLSGELGVSIDELFDLTVDQRLHRIEKRLDVEEEFSPDRFKEYEDFLKTQLEDNEDRVKILHLLAGLYHHRMEADSRRVSRLAREAILRKPEGRDTHWFLTKAEGQVCWDWNMSNHTAIIEFYKRVIREDTVTPRTPIPYYYVIDNLIADHRTKEATEYLRMLETIPAHKPHLIPVYEAHIALAEYDEARADAILRDALVRFHDDSGFLFELAQYHARKCEYNKALAYYEASWEKNERRPRFTDALHGMATIYEIIGDKRMAEQTYDRLIACIKDEWGYGDEDAAVLDIQREKARVSTQ